MSLNWINKIRNHKVPPPEGAWLNITNELDKEAGNVAHGLKEKMLAHETTPPANVLNNIFEELEKDSTNAPAYVERLKNHVEEAPAPVWNSIAAELDKEEEDTKVVPLFSKRKKLKGIYLRVAAAAAVIAIIIITIIPVIKRPQVGTDPIAKLPQQNKDGQISYPGTKNESIAAETVKNTAEKINSTTNTDKIKTIIIQQPTDYVKGNQITDLTQDPALYSKEKLQNSKGNVTTDITLMNTPNTYMSITGADGQPVKVSSKFSSLIGYLNPKNNDTRENIDAIIDENPKWKKIFAEWRNKMTNNTVAPSFSNFMDIIELSNVLEEKNK